MISLMIYGVVVGWNGVGCCVADLTDCEYLNARCLLREFAERLWCDEGVDELVLG